MSGIAPDGIERYRAVRDELEAAILPRATSLDGRSFTFQASLHGLALRPGGYVAVGDGRLGQLLSLQVDRVQAAAVDVDAVHADVSLRLVTGTGAVLGGDGAPFHDAELRPADAGELAPWLAAHAGTPLPIGTLRLAPDVPATVDARGLNRHTFVVGQSGSGKTYALGVLLEQLLVRTQLRIVVLDPNSDFVRLGVARPEATAGYAPPVHVHSARAGAGDRLRLRLAELDGAVQAALLRLDPVDDREEYAELAALLAAGGLPTVERLEATGRPEAHALALRVRNLGIPDLGVWAGAESGSVLEAVADPGLRCVDVDLGSLGTRDEQRLVAAAVLEHLWRRREQREPVLIVIDEAHNVCPAHPDDALAALATERAIRIAAEGRKYGLYLLACTQRPQKVHENVLTQMDNLVLMRLNSSADAAFAQAAFAFAPPGLVAAAPTFRQGEALLAGKFASGPAFVRFGERLSQEGGSDVPTTWASAADAAPPVSRARPGRSR